MSQRPSGSVRFRRVRAIAVAAAVVSPCLAASSAGATTSIGFRSPDALARVGSAIWVANAQSNSLVKLSASGVLDQRVSGARFHFAHPRALAVSGTKLFVANATGGVTELNGTTGALIRVLSAAHSHFAHPVAMAVHYPDVFVANQANSSITEISVTSGALVRVISNASGQPTRLADPSALVVASGGLWVTNESTNTLSEFATTTGAFIQTLSDPSFGFAAPAGISFDGTNLWVTDSSSDAVTEITASTAALVQVITNSSLSGGYGFDGPATTIAAHGFVYVVSPPGSSPMVTQVQASTGVANWMMCNTNYAFEFDNPAALLIDGAHLWVASAANNALVEMDATTGVLVTRVT